MDAPERGPCAHGMDACEAAGWPCTRTGLAATPRERERSEAIELTAVTQAQGGGLCGVGVRRGEKGWIWGVLRCSNFILKTSMYRQKR